MKQILSNTDIFDWEITDISGETHHPYDIKYIRGNSDVKECYRFVKHPDVSPNVRVYYTKIKKTDNEISHIFNSDDMMYEWEIIQEFHQVLPLAEAEKLLDDKLEL